MTSQSPTATTNLHNADPLAPKTPTNTQSLGSVLGGHFQKDPVSQEIDKEGVRAFGDDVYVPTDEGQKNTWSNLFSRQNLNEWKLIWTESTAKWRNLDTKWANCITKFKEENILSLGDIRVRSVLMAFSSAVLYKAITWNTVGLLRKSRNLGVSFVLNGIVFVPELFNPFLKKQRALQTL